MAKSKATSKPMPPVPLSIAVLNEAFDSVTGKHVEDFTAIVFGTSRDKWSKARQKKSTEAVMMLASLGFAYYQARNSSTLAACK